MISNDGFSVVAQIRTTAPSPRKAGMHLAGLVEMVYFVHKYDSPSPHVELHLCISSTSLISLMPEVTALNLKNGL